MALKAVAGLPRMQPMHRLPMPTCSRRAIAGVLLLWLCVVAASVWSPLARAHITAQSVERLCSGHGVVQWVHSPVAELAQGDTAALHHLIDCPLCLPVLAPPPAVHGVDLPVLPQQGVQASSTVFIPSHHQQWPPARGPPLEIFSL